MPYRSSRGHVLTPNSVRRPGGKDLQVNDRRPRLLTANAEPQILQMIADYGGADEYNGAHGTPRHALPVQSGACLDTKQRASPSW